MLNFRPVTKSFSHSIRLNTGRLLAGAGAFLLFAGALSAETIRLKNGRIILADSVREVNGRVEYSVGENTYALPKSSVERIDTGGSPVVTNSEAQERLPVPTISEDITAGGDQSAASKVIHDGKVDTDALAALESGGDKEIAATAYFLAAKYEMTHGSMEKAALYLEHAHLLLPGNDVLLVHQASVSAQMGKMADAASFAERAVRLAPANAAAFAMLGYADLQMDKLKAAVKALKRSIELQPDAGVEDMLARAQREVQAESTFAEEATSHFKLRFEGGQAAPELRRQILEILEIDFNDLVRALNFSPRESIYVILYTDKQFFDVTQAPSWSGALFDGKLRLPINGVKVVDTEFARVLKHELTHSFIAQLSRGKCPTWLHEGVAQIMEPRSASGSARDLAGLYIAQKNMPLNQLEGSFAGFSAEQAGLAYLESLLSVEYIRDTYGMGDVALILKRIGEGQSTESAMRSTIHSGYSQFEQELTTHLKQTYGG